jgi:hypothetical protein
MNKEIKIVVIDGIPKTSHSDRCNRMQPPKIEIFRHCFCLHFNHCSLQCPLHCDPSLLTSARGMKGGYDQHASKVIRKPWGWRRQECPRHWQYDLLLYYVIPKYMTNSNVKKKKKKKKNPWPESASELYRPSDRCLSAKWLPTFADTGCHVVSMTDPYGRILGFLGRSRYFSIK